MTALAAVLTLGLGWLVFGERSAPGAGPEVTSAGVALGTLVDERPSVAVLPLENLSGDPEDDVFTSGMHDEIQGRLSKIGGLRVIAREAVMRYAGPTPPLQEIAAELGVDNLITATVRRVADRVRILVRLIEPESGVTLWTADYDREFSLGQIFDIWTEVAEEIAQALSTELTADEQVRVAARPTDNQEAYDYFLLARSLYGRDRFRAAEVLQQAIEADPGFVDAWAWLAAAHVELWWRNDDHSDARLVLAREALDRAGELDANHVEYLTSLADYQYYALEQFQEAHDAYARAVGVDPNHSYAWAGMGFVRRRLGDFQGAVEAFISAESVSLRANNTREIATTYAQMRRWDDANAVEVRVRSLDAANLGNWTIFGTILYRQGSLTEAREDIHRAIAAGNTEPRTPRHLALIYIAERRYEEALSLIQAADYEAIRTAEFNEPRALLLARILDFAGRQEEARDLYEVAREYLEGELDRDPNNRWGLSALGLTLAGLGQAEAATESGRRAVALTPLDHYAYTGTIYLELLAAIYAKVGEVEAAMDLIEDLLARPSFLSVARLRMEPDWDPLREDARFRALLERKP